MHGRSCNSCGFVGKHHAVRLASPCCVCCATGGPTVIEVEKAWSAWWWDLRINGAVIYVERVMKVRMGSTWPCWRCVVWCRRVGMKRIFCWNRDSKSNMVKVNTVEQD